MMNKVVDTAYAIKFLKILVSDWKDMDAFHKGVIDGNGKVLVKRGQQSQEQKNSYTKFDVLVWNLKRILQKLPLGHTLMARYTAALKLIKEHAGDEADKIEESFKTFLSENFTAGIDMIDKPLGTKQEEPEVHTPDEEFANQAVFHVDTESYHKSRLGKTKFGRYKTYVGEDEIGRKVRGYALKNPNKSIMLKDMKTGHMLYLRRK